MGKSSSASLKKKKRSTDSSQSRKKKKIRVKKSNHKSKKPHRHDDDDSTSSLSFSSSSSEDYSRSRRKRSSSRPPKDLKISSSSKRKRSRKRHDATSESTDDDYINPKWKRKRSNDLKVKKKDYVKKKKKKKVYYSATSSSSDHSGSETEHERIVARGRLKTKGKEKSTRKQYRSKSSSSEAAIDFPIEEYVTVEKTISLAGRLKSVITVPDRGIEQGSGLYDAGYNDEMVYDRDDYPSSRSNDSNDGETRSDFSPPSNVNVASSEREPIGDEKGEALVSDIQSNKVEESGKGSEEHNCNLVGVDDVVKEIKSEVSDSMGTPSGDDLESILRQKALENLRKFRGKGISTIEKTPSIQRVEINSPVQQPSAPKSSSHEHMPKVENVSISARENDSHGLSRNGEKLLDKKDDQNESASTKEGVVCPPTEGPVIGNTKKTMEVNVRSISNRPNLRAPLIKRALSNIQTSASTVPYSPRPPRAKSVTQDSVDDNQIAETMLPESGNIGDAKGISVEQSSSPKPTLGGVTSDKMQGDAKEGSQFEEKKMTVMRGGEMVEVSYKVYIPKKTPALHRRQLNR
ncbi:hypothetical protein ACFE04_022145 [Oxalis oulophora]